MTRARRNRPVPNGCPLTATELELVQTIANGETDKQIALRTGRSRSTIRTHLNNAYRKLRVVNRTQAAVRCWHAGWITVDGINNTDRPVAPMPAPASPRPIPTPRAVSAADPKVSAAHRVYLYAFDLLLAARTETEVEAARAIMDRAARDAGIPMGSRRGDRVPDLLVRHLGIRRAA